jgi:glycosyltransferase involved in cell wall biosynthesis
MIAENMVSEKMRSKRKRYVALASLYNGETADYLRLSLNSALSQSLRIPIVIVVDGPINDTLNEILVEYENELFDIIYLEKNLGLGRALDQALDLLRNEFEYVIRFDTDDINLPTRFEKLVEAMEQKEFDLLGSSMVEFYVSSDNETIVLGERRTPVDEEGIRRIVHWRNPFNHPSICFNIEKAIRAGGYQHMPFFEDWFLWARMMACNASMGNLEENLVDFRGGPAALRRRRGLKYMKFEFTFFLALWRLNLPNKYEIILSLPLRLITRSLGGFMFKKVYYWSRALIR